METVLIIVPHDVEREALGALLGDEGYRVITARNGTEGRVALSDAPSAIVLDAAADGVAPLLDLLRSEALRDVPLLVLSSDDYDSRFVMAVGFLRKPFKPELLVAKVREWVRVPLQSAQRRARD